LCGKEICKLPDGVSKAENQQSEEEISFQNEVSSSFALPEPTENSGHPCNT